MLENIAENLEQTGVFICPSFLGKADCKTIADDLTRLRVDGAFHKAGIGQGAGHADGTRVREDETHWLNRELENAPQKVLWSKMDLLRHKLNRSLFLGLKNLEGHYAAYPAGGFYQRHRDGFHGSSDRVVSVVVYLNQNWQKGDGGQLRIYDRDKASFREIEPVGGTMVCFMSSETEHEVLVCRRERISFAGWFSRG